MTYRQTLSVEEATNTIIEYKQSTREVIPAYWLKAKAVVVTALEMTAPQCHVVRVSLSHNLAITRFNRYLNDYYRKRGYTVRWLWTKEKRPNDSLDYQGEHYHFALFTAQSQVANPLLPFIHAQAGGMLTSWWASRDLQGAGWVEYERQQNLPVKIHHIRTKQGLLECLEHLTYLAKVDTKHIKPTSRSIGSTATKGIEMLLRK